MRRLVATALLASAATLVGPAAAPADTIRGTQAADRINGTPRADAIYGRGGGDRLEGRGGPDFLHGGPGADVLLGAAGDDRIAAQADGAVDTVQCGLGRDIVNAELTDRVAADCEVVTHQLSRDTSTSELGQHETEVEPDSFAFGRTIVTAFQRGRFVDGGASDLGFATSTDAGATWRSGSLPSLTEYSSPSGDRDAVSDPVVAYDALHDAWLVTSLGLRGRSTELLVSRSRDGITWGRPIVAAQDPAEDYDKEWIACDNWRQSPLRGRCYISYLDFESGEIRTRRSSDGGLTWSAPVGVPGRTTSGVANGAQPVVRPDGTLVVLFTVSAAFASFADPEASQIVAVRSTDAAVSFSPRVRVARLSDEDVRGVRAPPLVSADVDAAGTVYVVWHDCRHRFECLANDIVLTRSANGVSWSGLTRIPIREEESTVDEFLPGLAVDPTSSGRTARLAVTYHSLPDDCELGVACRRVDVALARSADGGTTWRSQRLTAESMPLSWIADSSIGRMLGDYVSTSYVGGRPVPVFALASEPTGELLNQAIFATTRLPR